MSVNFERAFGLMSVIHKAAELGPKEANNISALAVEELRAMDNEAKEELLSRAKKAQEEELSKKAVEELRAMDEAEAKAEAERKPAPSIPRRT